MSRLAIVTTHPIQYYAPVFQAMAKKHPDTKVFYTWGEDSIQKFDPDFQKNIEWDIPLLEGYDYQFLKNTSSNPGTAHFKGIINPDAFRAIDEFNPDAILVYGWAWHSHLKIIRHYAKKKKVWFRGDSTLLDSTRGYKKFIRYVFLRWVYSHVDLAFYVGTQNKKYFQYFGLKDKQLKFAPHAIDNSRFSTDRKAEAGQLREQLHIPLSGKVVLFAGKLEPKKDPFTLLQAFEEVDDENLFLVFAGNGILEKELKERADQSVKKNNLAFLDFQNQSAMPVLYQACQIFCLPSVGPGETWGLAVNEAMAAGCAVIVSDKVGCAPDLVKEEKNGSIFRHKNSGDLARVIQSMIKKNDVLEESGEASKKIIENWSFEKQVSVILEELKKI
ncbi:MAG: glycosyltransferase [Flavisolibacter sp.]|nr:glycosyltransferase [Flavisolibacter sp.]